MTTKRVSFDMMNLGLPVHTDPFEVDRGSSQVSMRTDKEPTVTLLDSLLKKKLLEEANKVNSDFFIRDPSSSDDSDDSAFPETIHEQVRRLSFAKRRRLHYTEFATVELARRLVCEEFASDTSSLKSEDSAFRAEEQEEGCPECWTSPSELYPYFQYEQRTTTTSQVSDESAVKEDPEPGFDPSHPCYRKLVGQLTTPTTPKLDNTPGTTQVPSEIVLNQHRDTTTSKLSPADINKDLQESLERQTRVPDLDVKLQKGHKVPGDNVENLDLQQAHQISGASPQPSTKSNRFSTRKSQKPVGFRSI